MFNNWQRIEQIVRWSGASSVNAFARIIGLNRSENLYQIKRGNNGISRDLAQTIVSKYPAVSAAWILTGEGEMLIEDREAAARCAIPYYNIDAIGFLLSEEQIKPQYVLSLPPFEGCEFAAMYYGDAMSPEIGSGAILICRKASPATVTPGEIYLIVSDRFNGVRRIRREPGDSHFRLVAHDSQHYDDVIVEADSVQHLYHVDGVLKKLS